MPSSTNPLDDLVVERGHFVLESGLHAERRLDLDRWWVDPAAIEAPVAALSDLLRPYRPIAICGPLTGGAFVAQAIAMRMGARFYFAQPTPPTQPRRTAGTFGARYVLPPGQRAGASDERIAIVDDVVSAGSSVRATHRALLEARAEVVAIGALLVLGRRAIEHFASIGLALVANRFEPFDCFEPDRCPLCRAQVPLSNANEDAR